MPLSLRIPLFLGVLTIVLFVILNYSGQVHFHSAEHLNHNHAGITSKKKEKTKRNRPRTKAERQAAKEKLRQKLDKISQQNWPTKEAARAASQALSAVFPDHTYSQGPHRGEDAFPVYQIPDDRIPGEPLNPVNQAASDILECRPSVIEFVINATDVKDECGGLRKAFDAHCSTPDRPRRRGLSAGLAHWWSRSLQQLQPQTESEPNLPSSMISVPTETKHDVNAHTLSDALLFHETESHSAPQSQPKSQPQSAANVSPFQLSPEELLVCCSSIMSVFHEHCDFSDEEEYDDGTLFIIVAVIAMCSLVKSLIRHFQVRWLPEAAGCILVGAICGVIIDLVPHIDFGFDEKMFLRVMLPPIVFEAALSIDKRSFQRHLLPIFIYSCIGTLLATSLTALIVYQGSIFLGSKCTNIPLVESMAFGALISSIDPIAVLSVFNNIGISNTDSIYILIFGESLLNDGVALVLFDTLVHFLDDKIVMDSQAVFDAILHFFVVAFGSVAVGLLCGASCTMYFALMHGCHSPLVEVMTFFCWALIPFYLCDGIHWSGIVALVAAGFVMDLYVVGQKEVQNDANTNEPNHDHPQENNRVRNRAFFGGMGHMSAISKTHVHFVSEINSTIMETAIFAYLGLFLFNSRYHWNIYLSIIAIVACVLSRAIMIPLLTFASNRLSRSRGGRCRQSTTERVHIHAQNDVFIDKRMQIVLLVGGLRGAMSFALAVNIPLYDTVTGHGSRLKPELKAMTSACILFSVFIQGGGTYYLMKMLGMSPNKKDHNLGRDMLPLVPLRDDIMMRTSVDSETRRVNNNLRID